MQQVVSVAHPNRKQRRPSQADAALEAGEDEIGFLADFPPLTPGVFLDLNLFVFLNFVEGENDASDDGSPANSSDDASIHEVGGTLELTESDQLRTTAAGTTFSSVLPFGAENANGSRSSDSGLTRNMKVTLSAASEQALSTSYAVRSIGLPPSCKKSIIMIAAIWDIYMGLSLEKEKFLAPWIHLGRGTGGIADSK
ncbi:hypothetical protein DFH08DRAFT_817283 [Mycena albidolilacea]|uniref:Uncharacterized protein n=1 Tax=Mycena albidolilacea TaxID=1033008 RepID=A0AAD6ZJD3_9AGAR|nr:hypothetical protein DFH08DRAFT_817283 [Mycena albidolilacea]